MYDLFLRNGYSSSFFWNKANSILTKFCCPSIRIPTVSRAKLYIPLNFYGPVSEKFKSNVTKLVRNYYPQIKLQLAFRNRNSLGSFFHIKDEIPFMQRFRVVYMYTCGVCRDTYIGKTMRRLDDRIPEHVGVSARTGAAISTPLFSSIRNHMEDHGAPVNPEHFQIIATGASDADLKILETLANHFYDPKILSRETSLIVQIL